MTKLLEQAFAKVRELPDEEQDTLAAIILSMAVAPTLRVFRLIVRRKPPSAKVLLKPSEVSSFPMKSLCSSTNATAYGGYAILRAHSPIARLFSSTSIGVIRALLRRSRHFLKSGFPELGDLEFRSIV